MALLDLYSELHCQGANWYAHWWEVTHWPGAAPHTWEDQPSELQNVSNKITICETANIFCVFFLVIFSHGYIREISDNFAILISYPNNCYSLDISDSILVKEKGLKGLVVEMSLPSFICKENRNLLQFGKWPFVPTVAWTLDTVDSLGYGI